MDDAGGTNGADDANRGERVRNWVADSSAQTVVQAGSIGQVTIHQGTVRPPAPALRSLPPRPHTVVGRERDLAALLGHLNPAAGARGPHAVAVTGQGGVGKTVIAVEAAHEAVGRGWFPGSVLYADARAHHPGREAGLEELLDGFLRMLGVAGRDVPTHLVALEALFRGELVRHGERLGATLILVDDAPSVAELAGLVPPEAGHRLLVTSRKRPPDRPDLAVLPLEVFAPADSLALFRSGWQGPADEGDLAEVADLCGHLPLALSMAVARLREEGGDALGPLLSRLREGRDRLAELDLHGPFDTSYRALEARDARLLRLLALHPSTLIEPRSAAALAGLPEAEAVRGLRRLRRASLLLPASDGRVRFHDLVRLYAGERLAEGPPAERTEALSRLLRHFAERAARSAPWPEEERGAAVAALVEAAAAHLDEAVEQLGEPLAAYLVRHSHLIDALTVLGHRATAARRRRDHAVEQRALNQMSEVYTELRHVDHARACDRAGDLLRYRHGGAHVPLGVMRGRLHDLLGTQTLLQGRHAEAVTHLSRAERLWRRERRDRERAASLCTLGSAYLALGRVRQATSVLRQALLLAEAGDYPSVAALTHRELAEAALARGHAHAVVEHAKSAYALADRTGDHGVRVAMHATLARFALARGDLADARDWADLAVDLALLSAPLSTMLPHRLDALFADREVEEAESRRDAPRHVADGGRGDEERRARRDQVADLVTAALERPDDERLPPPPPPPDRALPASAWARLAVALLCVVAAPFVGLPPGAPSLPHSALWAGYLTLSALGLAGAYRTLTTGRDTFSAALASVWTMAGAGLGVLQAGPAIDAAWALVPQLTMLAPLVAFWHFHREVGAAAWRGVARLLRTRSD
ncbi:tetratricopeptide repeat protein [Streptomyces sp. enrichment culture]|uniref:tetratricopeptide repeat protein n=1 Tax=Streptomyces sp. enrichment culture TaxID=1795815 RepID=UPI003F57E62A